MGRGNEFDDPAGQSKILPREKERDDDDDCLENVAVFLQQEGDDSNDVLRTTNSGPSDPPFFGDVKKTRKQWRRVVIDALLTIGFVSLLVIGFTIGLRENDLEIMIRRKTVEGVSSSTVQLLSRDSTKNIYGGQRFRFTNAGVFLRQRNDGVLTLSLPIDRRTAGEIIWKTDPDDRATGDCYTRLQADGNLVTYKGAPDDFKRRSIWKSRSAGKRGDYIFALSHDKTMVFISENTIENAVWIEKTTFTPAGFTILLARDKNLGEKKILRGQTMEFSDASVFLHQRNDGKLTLRLGTDKNPGKVIWKTDPDDFAIDDSYTRLQADGNLVTYKDAPDDLKRGRIWKSRSAGKRGNYIFALSHDKTMVFISEDSIENAVWTEETTFAPSPNEPCQEKYDPGIICRVNADSCTFYVELNGSSCEAYCAERGGTCIEAFSDFDNGCKIDVEVPMSCGDTVQNQICTCSTELLTTDLPTHRPTEPPDNSDPLCDTCQMLTVKAQIDGRSQLMIHNNFLWWHHLDYAAPGLHRLDDGKGIPTLVNCQDWFPLWERNGNTHTRKEFEMYSCGECNSSKLDLCNVGS